MNKLNLLYPILWLLLLLPAACKDSNDIPEPLPEPPVPEQTFVDGFNLSLDYPNADSALTITFKAPEVSTLHGFGGDLYLYSGIGAQWKGSPASWTDNQTRNKMTAVAGASSTWTITLTESLRKYYGISSTEPLQTLNLIVRTPDGSKQTGDYILPVADKNSNFSLAPSQQQAVPVGGDDPEGIHINSASSVTLVLYDNDNAGKHKSHAYVVGSFNDWTLDGRYQMKYDDARHCWWITLENLPSTGFTFQYFVYSSSAGGAYLCDPYSKEVLEQSVDSDFPSKAYGRYVSFVNTSTADYTPSIAHFRVADPGNMVIYEMLLRDFTETHNLEGARRKIDYLKSLGVNAVELMPIQEFEGGSSWGYNTSLYFATDRSYGLPAAYKTFIDECHKAGLAVILDVVYNHTNSHNPFAKLYWDVFNNRPSASNPWINAETPHKKYVFSSADFNHQSEQTRRFVKRNLKYLMKEYNVDGFRFDFTKGFTQRATTGDGDLSAYDGDRVSVLRQYAAAVKEQKSDAIVIMEHFCDAEEKELAADGIMFWRNMNNAYAQAAMGWKENSDFSNLYDKSFPASFVGYMESHDEERLGYKQTQWGDGALKTDLSTRMKQLGTDAAFFLLVPGPKMIWQFGEMGYDFSINSDASGSTISEDNRTAPKPIRWDYLETDTRRQLSDTYAKLIALRNAHPELFSSDATLQWKAAASNWTTGRTIHLKSSGGKELVVLGNFTAQPANITFPAYPGTWQNYLTGNPEEVFQTLTIPANTFSVYIKE